MTEESHISPRGYLRFLISFGITESNHIFQLKNFNKTNIQKIEQNWDEIRHNIYKSIKLLSEHGYAKNNLTTAYILSTIAFYLYRHDVNIKSLSNSEKKEILRFIQNAQIKGYFTTSLDSKLENIAKGIKSTNNFAEFNNYLKEKNILKITNDDIERMVDLEFKNKSTFAVLQILYPDLDYRNSTFHIDHIYPKSKFSQKSPERDDSKNYIYNLQLLEGGENLEKGTKDPEEWIKEVCEGDKEKISKYKERHYIDKDFVSSWENNEAFDKMRCENVLKSLKKKLSNW